MLPSFPSASGVAYVHDTIFRSLEYLQHARRPFAPALPPFCRREISYIDVQHAFRHREGSSREKVRAQMA